MALRLTSAIVKRQAALSQTQARFLEFAARNPAAFSRRAFSEVHRKSEFGRFAMQSWPMFLSATRRDEIAQASLAICRLIRSIPERIFGNDPSKLAWFYDLDLPTARRNAALIGATGLLDRVTARADLIWTPKGPRICEINFAGWLGGWEMSAWEARFRCVPLLRRFFTQEGIVPRFTDPLRTLCAHAIEAGLAAGLGVAGELNLAFCQTEPDETFLPLLDARYREALAALAPGLGGRVVLCQDGDLSLRRGRLHLGRLAIHLMLDTFEGRFGRAAFSACANGAALAFDGPATAILSDKRNLALLSEAVEAGGFLSAAERAIVSAYLPWTRRLVSGHSLFRGERAELSYLAVAHRRDLVLKRGLSLGGEHVVVGRSTSPAVWRRRVGEALAEGDWILQEYALPIPYLFQHPAGGAAPHDLVWGIFMNGNRYGGGLLRMVPRGADTVINVGRGAAEGLIFEVEV